MVKIEIKSLSGSLLFLSEHENNSIKKTLEEAVRKGAHLRGADLRGAYLEGADLRGADLREADLIGADLIGADLRGADLRGAHLRGANLLGAHLLGAHLRGANLEGANLDPIKNDLFNVLIKAIPEIKNFRQAIVHGKIDGSTYHGECACLCGTLEKSNSPIIANRIKNQRNSNRPIEIFFLGIKKGDTPETNQFSKIALEWTDEFLSYLTEANTIN